jgi:outer membrane protein OmpA-like peptidoglycan-associated protein
LKNIKRIIVLIAILFTLPLMAETKIPERENNGFQNINERKEYTYDVYPGEKIWHEHGRAYWKATSVAKKQVRVEKVVKEKVVAAPLDSDRDGVIDSKDRCPNTVAGSKVNVFGCVKKKMRIDVNFELNSAVLKQNYLEDINKIGKVLSEDPELRIMIGGHTDTTGKASFNKKLSESRSEAVARYLLENFEIKKDQLKTAGFGEEKPIADNTTRSGRKLNRRVEAEIL